MPPILKLRSQVSLLPPLPPPADHPLHPAPRRQKAGRTPPICVQWESLFIPVFQILHFLTFVFEIRVDFSNMCWVESYPSLHPNLVSCFHLMPILEMSFQTIVEQSLTRGQKVRSRRERETWNSFPQFREGKKKCEKGFSTFEKWKRKGYSFLKFREEKENFF